jgi:hypothetical protein
MNERMRWLILCTSVLAAAVGCTKSSPASPSSSASVGPNVVLATASIGAPRPLSPANGAQIKNSDQPVTLVAQNALITLGGAGTYTFEVATDPAFATKVQVKDGVAEGSGQTLVKLDPLAAATDYYWHVRATGGGTTGVFGPAFKFTIGPLIAINPPAPLSPSNGAQTSGQPTLTVVNATRSGPTGAIVYRFDISTSPTFATVALSNTVGEGPTQTSFTPATSLVINVTYYWRVVAIDSASGTSSPASATQSFSTTNPLWPGVQPPGTNGHAIQGNGWGQTTIVSFTGVTFTSPTVEELRIFDLLDKGFDPDGALAWMNSNGYPTSAVYYSSVDAIGFQFQYLARIGGAWSLVTRVGS